MVPDLIEIEIVGWEKFQHHNGKKTYGWFKMSSSFFEDHEMRNLRDSEKVVWVYLLCCAAKVRSSVIKVDPKLIASDCKVYRKFVESAITKLEGFQIVRIVSGTQCVPQSRIEESTIEKKRIEKRRVEKTVPETPQLDLVAEPPKKKKTPSVAKATPDPTASTLLFDIYAEEYILRWKKEPPPRNARINANLSRLAKEFGLDKAQELVKHYFKMPDAYYLKNFHPIGLLISQAHQIYSSMTTGRTHTQGMLRGMDNAATLHETLSAIDRGEV